MGTEVLRPRDCLNELNRISPAVLPRRRSCNYGNSYSNPRVNNNPRPSRKQQPQQQQARPEKFDRRRRAASEPSISYRSSSDELRTGGGSCLVIEKVTILRRGQSLDSKLRSEAGLRNEGGEPATSGRCDVYAGSAFAVSPEPSSLPLPSFSKKKQAAIAIDDSATRDLRRLLRLD